MRLPVTRRSWREGLVLFALVAAAFWSGVYGFSRGSDPDYWWHLAVGRHFARTGHLPAVDDWSFTLPGSPWLPHSWLAELVLYAGHARFGPVGPLVLTGAVFAALLALLLADQWRHGATRLRAVGVGALLLVAMDRFAYPRPQMFGFIFFLVTLLALERFVERGGVKRLALLAPVVLLWANVHPSFVLGLVLMGNVFLGALLTRLVRAGRPPALDRRALLALASVGACAAALTTVNPAGPALLRYVLGKPAQPMRALLVEWQPLDVASLVGVPFALLLLTLVVAVVRRGGFVHLHHALLCGVAAYSALSCVRDVPFAVMAFAVVSARTFPEEAPAGDGASPLEVSRRVAVVLDAVILAVVGLAPAFLGGAPYDEASDPRLPAKAVAAVGSELARARPFHEFDWGGWLVWRFGEERAVFVDGRADHFIAEGVLGEYFAAWRVTPEVDRVLDKYAVGAVLLRPSTPLLQYAVATGRCTKVHADELAVFARCK